MTINIAPSRWLLFITAFACAVTASIPWLLGIQQAALFSAVVLMAAFPALKRVVSPEVKALHMAGKQLEITLRSGARLWMQVQSQSVVMPGLVVLILRGAGRSVPLVLPSDATGPEEHRQLRVWLRWQVQAV